MKKGVAFITYIHVYMIDRMKDQNIFAHVNLVKGERSQLSELASNLL